MRSAYNPRSDFMKTVRAAMDDFVRNGFDTQERLNRWLTQLHAAAKAALVPEQQLVRSLREALTKVYQRNLKMRKLLKAHPKVSQFTINQIAPKLRAELDRRILASASLIRLNRDASIQRTLQRFAGWASSVPAGGATSPKVQEEFKSVGKGIAGLPFEERRVIIDQGHKLNAAVNDIIAVDNGAIAAIWHSRWRETGYDYRPEHKERDQELYLIRDSWAMKRGLVKLAGHQYTDQITQPAEEPFCRCTYEYIYALRDLPEAVLTQKGQEALEAVRGKN